MLISGLKEHLDSINNKKKVNKFLFASISYFKWRRNDLQHHPRTIYYKNSCMVYHCGWNDFEALWTKFTTSTDYGRRHTFFAPITSSQKSEAVDLQGRVIGIIWLLESLRVLFTLSLAIYVQIQYPWSPVFITASTFTPLVNFILCYWDAS